MQFKKLVFANYKTYYGHQEVNFYIPMEVRKEKEKNIILMGGLNGAGKTTILKAILYVLFGKRGVSEQEYTRLFSNVINNTFFDEGGRDCSINLILETDSREEWQLKVKWTFDNNKRVISESRDIIIRKQGLQHGQPVRIDNIEAFNRFIDKVIPYHAAPFFIFDGEEIKDIILRQNSTEMKEAIHKISGMEGYKQLLTDLQQIKGHIEQKLANSVNLSKVERLDNELKDVKVQIIELEKKKEGSQAEAKKLEKQIGDVKQTRNQKVSQNAKSREVLVKKQSRLDTELNHTKQEFENHFNEHAVQIILGNKISKLKKQLKLENDLRHRKILQAASLTPYRNFMNQLLSQPISPPLTETQLGQIKKLGEEIWTKENDIKQDVPKDSKEIHDLSSSENNYLLNLLVKDKHLIVQLINKIEKLNLEIHDVELEIRNAPESVDINEENEKIDKLTRKLGEKEIMYKAVLKKLSRALETNTTLLNQITRLSGQSEDYEELKTRLDYINRLISAMSEYVRRITTLKAQFIREEFSYMLHQLFRKQDEFGKIEFNIETYTIRLFNDRDQEISIQERSAGEMQMISSALIWALTKASDLSLPMVIDTPLGRLDSFHRNHLIKHYYNELSDQVIILSTDTEITQDYVDFMSKHSYRQYMLDYDEDKKYTVIRDGYFDFVKV